MNLASSYVARRVARLCGAAPVVWTLVVWATANAWSPAGEPRAGEVVLNPNVVEPNEPIRLRVESPQALANPFVRSARQVDKAGGIDGGDSRVVLASENTEAGPVRITAVEEPKPRRSKTRSEPAPATAPANRSSPPPADLQPALAPAKVVVRPGAKKAATMRERANYAAQDDDEAASGPTTSPSPAPADGRHPATRGSFASLDGDPQVVAGPPAAAVQMPRTVELLEQAETATAQPPETRPAPMIESPEAEPEAQPTTWAQRLFGTTGKPKTAAKPAPAPKKQGSSGMGSLFGGLFGRSAPEVAEPSRPTEPRRTPPARQSQPISRPYEQPARVAERPRPTPPSAARSRLGAPQFDSNPRLASEPDDSQPY